MPSDARDLSGRSRTVPGHRFWFPAAFFFLLLPFFAGYQADPDLWGHLTFGNEMLSTGQVLRGDPYSFTAQGLMEYRHEWLSEVFISIFWNLGGPASLWLYGTLLIALILAASVWLIRSRSKHAITLFFMLTFMLTCMRIGFNLRAHLYTYLFLIVMLNVLERFERRPGLVWVLPLLFTFWANVHGGFVAGLALLTVFGISYEISARFSGGGRTSLRLLSASVIALCFLATLINPYGPALWRFLLHAITMPRPHITEWQNLIAWISDEKGALAIVPFFILPAWLYFRYKSRFRLFDLLSLFFMTAAAAKSIRFVPMATVVWPLFITPVFDAHVENFIKGITPGKKFFQGMTYGIVFLIVIACAVAFGKQLQAGETGIYVDSKSYPLQFVDYLRRSGLRGNMINPFNWGEFLIAQTYPAIRVSIDGRYETVYPKDVVDRNIALYKYPSADNPLLHSPNADFIVIETGDNKLKTLLAKTAHWTLIYSDPIATFYAKTGHPATRRTAGPEMASIQNIPKNVPFRLHTSLIEYLQD